MHVGLGNVREIIVDHVGDPLDIDSASRDVGGYENIGVAPAKSFQGSHPSVL
jgi:hypothetical protein